MQQTPPHYRHSFSSLLTGLLLCWSSLLGADPLTDPNTNPPPVIDTSTPTSITGYAATKNFNATQPIRIIDLETEIGNANPTEIEVTDGVVFKFNPTGTLGPLIPGQYTITWTATDLGFNQLVTDPKQLINVLPSINFAPDQEIGEGGTAVVTAHLSGKAPIYPFTVNFTIDNSNNNGGGVDNGTNDHSLLGTTGSLVFNEGETEKSISIDIYTDPDSNQNESILLTLDTLNFPDDTVWASAGHRVNHKIDITQPSINHAPLARLQAWQDEKVTRAITVSGGTVSICAMPVANFTSGCSADAYDANGDTIQYDWSATDNALTPTSGTTASSFSFEPLGLTPGFYTVRLTVSDAAGLSTSHDLLLLFLLENDIELAEDTDSDDDGIDDTDEGFHDSDNDGIPNYLDAVEANTALMQGFEPYLFDSNLKEQDTLAVDSIELDWEISSTASNLIVYPLLLEVDPGYQINVGPTAFGATNPYARITTTTAENLRGISLDEKLVSSDGQVVDIEITHLNRAGDSALVVIPQSAPIPSSQSNSPEFIVFSNLKTWESFEIDANNQIHITSKDNNDGNDEVEDDYCPGLGATAEYTPGLSVDPDSYVNPLASGTDCLLIKIEDGGPNDYDGVANGSIRLMGSVFVTSDSTSATTPPDDETFTGSKDAIFESSNKLNLGTGDGGGSIGFISLLALLAARLLRGRANSSQ